MFFTGKSSSGAVFMPESETKCYKTGGIMLKSNNCMEKRFMKK